MNIEDFKNFEEFVKKQNVSNEEIDNFVDYLSNYISDKELFNLSYYDLVNLYEDAYKSQSELYIYKSLYYLGEDWGNNSSLFEDEDNPDYEEIGQFYIKNYKNNYTGAESICIELCSGRVLTVV